MVPPLAVEELGEEVWGPVVCTVTVVKLEEEGVASEVVVPVNVMVEGVGPDVVVSGLAVVEPGALVLICVVAAVDVAMPPGCDVAAFKEVLK